MKLQDVLGEQFNAEEEAGDNEFQVVAPGWYPCTIIGAELKETKARNGHFVEVICETIEGGHRAWGRFNILNPNEKAQAYGRRQLGNLGIACGLPVISDTDELLGKEVQAYFTVDEGADKPVNTTEDFIPIGETPPYELKKRDREQNRAPATAPAPKRKEAPPASPAQEAAEMKPQPTASKPAAAAANGARKKRPWER